MNAMTVASQHAYNPDVRFVQYEEEVIDTIAAEKLFNEKYVTEERKKYLLLEERYKKVCNLCQKAKEGNKKVKSMEEIAILEQAYYEYKHTHPAYRTEKGSAFIPLPIVMSVEIPTREKTFTRDDVELTDKHLKKGKITSEVKIYLSYYKSLLENRLNDIDARINKGWSSWLKSEEIPYKMITKSKTNPYYRGLYYYDNQSLDEIEYPGLIKGWEFLGEHKGVLREDVYPEKISYYLYDEIPDYKVFKEEKGPSNVFDSAGKLIYVSSFTRRFNYKEIKDVKRQVYLKDYNNNKYDIKSEPAATQTFLNKFLVASDGLNILQGKRDRIFSSSMFEAVVSPRMVADITGLSLPRSRIERAKQRAGNEYRELQKEMDSKGIAFIEQLEKDHKDDFKFLYIIERLSDTRFKVLFLNGNSLEPSYCAEVSYVTGAKPYTVTYSTKLVPIPSNVPPIIVR